MYDDYFTNDDKPYAENLNDALLLSNVFDMSVSVTAPDMFSNKAWVSTTSPRKCGVSICTLTDKDSNVLVGLQDNKSVLMGTGSVMLEWYPNFNSFGKYESIAWDSDGIVQVDLFSKEGTIIADNIENGAILDSYISLQKLEPILIVVNLSNATLYSLTVNMKNKEETRYGATVGISDVTNLNAELEELDDAIITNTFHINGLENNLNNLDDNLVALENALSWQTMTLTVNNITATLRINPFLKIGHLYCAYTGSVNDYLNIPYSSVFNPNYLPSHMGWHYNVINGEIIRIIDTTVWDILIIVHYSCVLAE